MVSFLSLHAVKLCLRTGSQKGRKAEMKPGKKTRIIINSGSGDDQSTQEYWSLFQIAVSYKRGTHTSSPVSISKRIIIRDTGRGTETHCHGTHVELQQAGLGEGEAMSC